MTLDAYAGFDEDPSGVAAGVTLTEPLRTIAKLVGAWTTGTVRGHLHERGWGADDGCPGIVFDVSGPQVEVHAAERRFRGSGYERVRVMVHRDGAEVAA